VPHFEDYHRTVIGYHGTRRPVALRAVQGLEPIAPSRKPGDWLGHGVYFWEYAPQQAWLWAEAVRRANRWDDETDVLGCMIRLGNCFDLLDPENAKDLRELHQGYLNVETAAGRRPAVNVRSDKRLNCAVFEYAYAMFGEKGQAVDTCRAVFVPSGRDQLWRGSGINPRAHIQVVVRNPANLLGTWLVRPHEEQADGHREASEAV
jgi:hypothetical protein